MASYPNAIFEPRVVENLEGIEYNADDKKTLFAEDYNKSNDEILAVEQTLGTEVNGDFETLAARINHLEAVIVGMNDKHCPVGTVYFNATDPRNPSEILGFGTWEPYAQGRNIIGIASSGAFSTLGAQVGSATQTITVEQLPSHNHSNGTLTAASAGAHSHPISESNGNPGSTWRLSTFQSSGTNNTMSTNSAGAHTHNVTGATSNTGSGAALSIVQPGVISMSWVRTH